MEINDRQRQQLSTCMSSCRNIAYPSLGLVEEVGEYIQKLIYMIQWNPAFPVKEKDHLLFLLQGIATNAYAVGRLNKEVRHGTYPQPFTLKHSPSAATVFEASAEDDDNSFFQERVVSLQKELGDIDWMVNAAHFFTIHPDGTDPTAPDCPMTAQLMHDQNYAKLAERRLQNTIDGQGDTTRTNI